MYEHFQRLTSMIYLRSYFITYLPFLIIRPAAAAVLSLPDFCSPKPWSGRNQMYTSAWMLGRTCEILTHIISPTALVIFREGQKCEIWPQIST